MSISPPSDIVLGVAAAADPEKYRAAVARLTQLGNDAAPTEAANSAQFTVPTAPTGSSASASVTPAASSGAPFAIGQSAPGNAPTPNASTEREHKAYKQLEAFLMQTYIESMLPKDASSVYGTGMAGDFWRSMLAEHTANELAKSSTLGIAESIMKAKTKQNASLTAGAAQPSAASPGALNTALFQLQSIASGGTQLSTLTSMGTSPLARQGS